MEKLDELKNVNSLAKKRDVGAIVNRPAPTNAKKWMIAGTDSEADFHTTELSDDQTDLLQQQ